MTGTAHPFDCQLCRLASEIRKAEDRHVRVYEIMARNGDARVWLSGGINNPGSDEPTVIKIYGALTPEHRKLLMDAVLAVENPS